LRRCEKKEGGRLGRCEKKEGGRLGRCEGVRRWKVEMRKRAQGTWHMAQGARQKGEK
jgi:hypothetical protein